jgi:DNA (cytosine-5)-methyltransferase 1
MAKKVISLFSGCGGMDLGFEGGFTILPESLNSKIHPDWAEKQKNGTILLSRTSFENIFANDILKSARSAWIPYFSKRGKSSESFHLESVVDLVKKHQQGEHIFPNDIDVVTGGFPCQDFSVAGKRRGLNSHKNHLGIIQPEKEDPTEENRGRLYTWMRAVIELTKPKVFIAENVKGLVSLGNVKTIIENDFRSIDKEGYLLISGQVLNAADYGVPQNRERVIFIGFNKRFMRKEAQKALNELRVPDEYNPYPKKTHFKNISNGSLPIFGNYDLRPYVTTRTALRGLAEPEMEQNDRSQMFYSKAKYCPQQQGNVEIKFDDVGPTIRAEHHGNIEYRRLSHEHGGKIIEELESGLQERRLTIRECARIQTFPDDYEFVRNDDKNDPFNLSASSAYKLIGNAVPPLLAYNVAKRLEEIWDIVFAE